MLAVPCEGRSRPDDATSHSAARPAASLSALAARELVLSCVQVHDVVTVRLADAVGHVLASDLRARGDSPPADLSSVDGFAIACDESAAVGARFQLVGESAAGCPFAGTLQRGQAVQIFTGAELPAGARRVLPTECVTAQAAAVTVTARDGETHIRQRAQNHSAGAVVLHAGAELGPLELALAASAGHGRLAVHRPARIAHLVTGSELVPAGVATGPAQIPDSNGPLVASLARRAGAELVGQTLVGDDLAACRAALEAMPPHDVLLISGGAGYGGYDFAVPLLTSLGFAIHFRSVAIRPGKPLAFATRGRQLAFALPGNPVSHWATWQLFVGPALLRLAGHECPSVLPLHCGQLDTAWSGGVSVREVFWPVRVEWREKGWQVHPCRFGNSGDLAGVAGANALLCAPWSGHADVGSTVQFIFCR
ncbi:MAG: molybdopterin molybdenumtransferase MoeA [Opitutus sp.]|nr:molybdopterin molybdenumtransferase MoeA [Opitutus sp.]